MPTRTKRVSPGLLALLHNARKILKDCPEPEATELTVRCDRLLGRINVGHLSTNCEVATELRSILDGMESLLSQQVPL